MAFAHPDENITFPVIVPKREDSLTLFHFQVFVHFNEFPVKYKYSLDLIAVSKSLVLC